MPNPTTALLGLTPPTVGSDINTWGGELNTDLAILDLLGAADVRAVSANLVLVIAQPITVLNITTGAGGVTVTLPAPSATIKGRVVLAKKMDSAAGAATLTPALGNIESAANYQLVNQNQGVVLVADAANWWAYAKQ